MSLEETFLFQVNEIGIGQVLPEISSMESQNYLDFQGEKKFIGTCDGQLIPPPTNQGQQMKNQVPPIYFLGDSLAPSPFINLQYKEIFIESNTQRKNTNFVKFLISNFNKQIKNNKYELSQEHIQFLQRVKQIYESNGKRNITIEALCLLFGGSQQNAFLKKKNKKILFDYLGSKEFKVNSIWKNIFMDQKNKKQHLLASKVYRLRCCSKYLVSRIQTK